MKKFKYMTQIRSVITFASILFGHTMYSLQTDSKRSPGQPSRPLANYQQLRQRQQQHEQEQEKIVQKKVYHSGLEAKNSPERVALRKARIIQTDILKSISNIPQFKSISLDPINRIFGNNTIKKAQDSIIEFIEKWQKTVCSYKELTTFNKDEEDLHGQLVFFASRLIKQMYYVEKNMTLSITAGMFFIYLTNNNAENPFRKKDQLLYYETIKLINGFKYFFTNFSYKNIEEINNKIIYHAYADKTFTDLISLLDQFYTNIQHEKKIEEDSQWLNALKQKASEYPDKKTAQEATAKLLRNHSEKMTEDTWFTLIYIFETFSKALAAEPNKVEDTAAFEPVNNNNNNNNNNVRLFTQADNQPGFVITNPPARFRNQPAQQNQRRRSECNYPVENPSTQPADNTQRGQSPRVRPFEFIDTTIDSRQPKKEPSLYTQKTQKKIIQALAPKAQDIKRVLINIIEKQNKNSGPLKHPNLERAISAHDVEQIIEEIDKILHTAKVILES